jgi:LysM repeat protein
MKDDPELQIDDAWSDHKTYSPKRKRTGSGNSKSLRILLVILLVLVFAGGILYFFGKLRMGSETSPLLSRVTALEQKISRLERQLVELQGKVEASGTDSTLLQRVESMTQKVEALEKQRQSIAESKAKPSAPLKSVVSAEKQYHTVQKGESLYRISKKYGISVEELTKLNNLSVDQPLRTGQKLLVSPGR